MNEKYQRCSKCIMDTSVPGITFDIEGECNYCLLQKELDRKNLADSKSLDERLLLKASEIKKSGEGNEYDCVIGTSGGADSTYALYVAKKYGLRPLAVHFDNGWNSEVAVRNIKNSVDSLDIDLYTYVVDWEEFKDIQLSFLKASVSDAEIPTDLAIKGVLYKTAADHGVKYILTGSNYETEGPLMPKNWTYMDGRYIKDVQQRFGRKKIKSFPNLKLSNRIMYSLIKRIRLIKVLNYVPYNKKTVMEMLENDLGWEYYGGKHHESIYTKFFQSYILPHKFKIDKRITEFSALVRSGQMDREEAIEEIKKPTFDKAFFEQDLSYICKKFGINKDEFNQILNAPPKNFHDYKTYYPYKKYGRFLKVLFDKVTE
jgi:N-acetyl sugar amidotransferase